MQGRFAFCLIVALFVVGAVAQLTTLTATTANGFDVIVLDEPSWVTHIQLGFFGHGGDSFYVFGDRTLRTITAGGRDNVSEFTALPVTDQWNFPLIDLHTFYNLNFTGDGKYQKFTFGLTDYSIDNAALFQNKGVGPYIPFVVFRQNLNSTAPSAQFLQGANTTSDWRGFMNYGIRVDARNITNVVTYVAGFVTDGISVNFALTRAYNNPTSVGLLFTSDAQFIYNHSVDYFFLYDDGYTAFSNVFRPWVHYLENYGPLNITLVLVIDPNTRSVFAVDVTNGAPFTKFQFLDGYQDVDVVSVFMDYISMNLFVGLGTAGFAPGMIAAFSFANQPLLSVPIPSIYPLPQNYSNPKALASDGINLYIGMNGFNEILQMSVTNGSFMGYQRLPDYLHRSWDATFTTHHVYFVTYEQNSKVYRVAKSDFCPASCPYNGYCTKGKCTCSVGYIMTSGGSECLLEAQHEVTVYKNKYFATHEGEVVLGVFFAIMFVVAAAGWFMWFRGRRAAYQAV